MGAPVCRPAARRNLLYVCVGVCAIYTLYFIFSCSRLSAYSTQWDGVYAQGSVRYIYDDKNRSIAYGDDAELIFIGGMPRSGTTLMRVMLDAHPDVRCGEETRVVPRILGMRTLVERTKIEKIRLEEAGVTSEVLDSAVRAFILEVIAKHGKAAPRLCNKDPFALRSTIYLSQQFQRSRFILMIRDGRAVVHSIIKRNVTITGFNLKSYRDYLSKWSEIMDKMYASCLRVGPDRCLPVYYEQLVLRPRVWLERVTTFLKLPWNEAVMHHEDFIGQGQKISLSKVEKSTDQVMKPVYRDSLAAWVDKIPRVVVQAMDTTAPMLRTLGYDPHANPPDYQHPPQQVADNTLHILDNAHFWKGRTLDPFDLELKQATAAPGPRAIFDSHPEGPLAQQGEGQKQEGEGGDDATDDGDDDDALYRAGHLSPDDVQRNLAKQARGEPLQ